MRTIQQLILLKKATKELIETGEEEHEGSLIDLANLLPKIIDIYEKKGEP